MSIESISKLKEQGTNLISVKELFADSYYRIPDYQRGYAWNKEFVDLWQDVLRLSKTGKAGSKHYTGMLALDEIPKDANESLPLEADAYYVVDGQQRITSIVVLIQSIFSYIKEEIPDYSNDEIHNLLIHNKYFKFGYSNKRQDGATNYFRQRIFQKGHPEKPSSQYLLNINNAKEFIDKELKKFSGEEANDILSVILNRLVFNVYFVDPDVFDVRVTFETMNNRGKKLSNLELLKNRLMYLTTWFPNSDDSNRLKESINDTWKEIYENLCLEKKQLSDDDYLKAHWIVYDHLNKRKGDAYIDDLLEKEFSVDYGIFHDMIQEAKATSDYQKALKHIEEYVDSLKEYSKYWRAVNQPKESKIPLTSEEKSWLNRFIGIGSTLYLKAVLMTVIGTAELTETKKAEFYKLTERFIFINKLLAQDRNDLSFLVTAAHDLMRANSAEKNVKLKIICDQIEKHSLNINDKRAKHAIKVFGEYISEKNYYSWKGLTYFLCRYNESLNKNKNISIDSIDYGQDTSIEHILPQTPTCEYWMVAFSEYSEESLWKITNSLGNLLLLSSGSENSQLQNYSYPVKRDSEIYSRKFAYRYGSLSAQEVAKEDYWTIKEIYDRTIRLLKFMYTTWFSEIDGFSEKDWTECVKESNLINFEYNQSDAQYQSIIRRLDTLKKEDEPTEMERRPDNLREKEILEYFDQDIISIHYGTYIQYQSRFHFKLKDNPRTFECKVQSNGKNLYITYEYESNEIRIWYKQGDRYCSKEELEETDEKIKRFLRDFYRYLRQTQNVSEPHWIN